MRYDRLWRNLVDRAVKQGGLDVDTFVQQAVDSGMSAGSVQQRLIDDLDNDGPIFGRFFRQLSGAAEGSVLSAHRAGSYLGDLRDDPDYRELMDLANTDDVINEGTPEAIEEIRRGIEERDERMWVAELRKTCHLCLPLHGTVQTMEEWRESGFDPDTIHSSEGWVSPCYCQLVPASQVADRKDVMAPLVRAPLESPTGKKLWAKTRRGVTQVDVDKALTSRDKALESLTGRRTMRLLGQSSVTGDDDGR